MKGKTMLKITAILMIIGGVVSAIVGILGVVGVAALSAMAGSAEGTGLLYFSLILVIVASIIEFIAGIVGVGASNDPAKAKSCIVWGGIVAALAVVSMIINLAGGGSFDVVSLLLNLVLPVLYIIGTVMLKKAADSTSQL